MRMSLLVSMLLVFGCRETSVRVTNKEPTADIVAPADGDVVLEGYTVTLVGAAGDPDDLSSELTTTWFVDSEEVCPAAPAADDGTTTCQAVFTDDSQGQVVLQVTDPSDATSTARINVVIEPTEAPSAQIFRPLPDAKYYADLLIELEGQGTDAEDGPEDLIASWSSSLGDNLTGLDSAPDSTGTVTASTYLQEGQHQLTLTLTDATGKTGTDTVVVAVGPPNSPPSCAITAPEDGATGEDGETVVFQGNATDEDVTNDLLSVSFSSDKMGDLGSVTPSSDGTVVFPFSGLTVQTHLITMTVSDELDATCTALTTYTVATPPTVSITAPEESALVATGDAVSFEANVDDNDGILRQHGYEMNSRGQFAQVQLSWDTCVMMRGGKEVI